MPATVISLRTRRPLYAEPTSAREDAMIGSCIGIAWVIAFWIVVGLIGVGVWG